MKSSFSRSFIGGWFNAVCSFILSVSRDDASRCITSAHAIYCKSGTSRALRRQKVWNLHRDSNRNVPHRFGHDGAMWVRVQERKMQRVISATVIVAVVLLTSPVRGQELDAAWFKANYLPAAERLHKAYSECSATVSETTTNNKTDDHTKTTYIFAFDGAQRKFDRTIEDYKNGKVDGFRRVIVASPEVSFKVFTKGDKGPLLESVKRTSMGFAQASKRIEEEASDSIYSAFAFHDEEVSSWMKHKGFQIKGVKREGNKVRFSFYCKNDDGREYDGWVDFLPDRQWVIDSWDITTQTPTDTWRDVVAVSYGGNDPVPAMTGMTDIGHHPNQINTRRLTIEDLSFAKVPASEFKLSAYGYDDRIGSPASVTKSLWFWLAGAGIICLLVALGIRLRYRHALQ